MIRPDPQPAVGTRGAVSSSHRLVSHVGASVLASGGNAFDATIAMAAMSWLLLPGQCGIGGDAFVLVREPGGETWTSNGSGFGPDGGTPDFYRDLGLDSLPLTGPLSVAVPGTPAVLSTLHAHATRSLKELWEPAIKAATDGVPCSPKTRADVAEQVNELARNPGARTVFAPGGAPPRVGQLVRQPELGATLRGLADDLDAFYTGWFAHRAVASLADSGAPFSGEEWALGAHAPHEPAITTTYSGRRLHQTPPPSAGWMVLHQACILDGTLGRLDQLGPEAVHWFAEAARASFRHRFEHCGADNDEWRRALEDDAVAATRHEIGRTMATSAPVGGAGDTTSMVCVDPDGTAVSFIHSLAFTFGSRVTVPGTGVLLNNRLGRGAYLLDGHPNEVRPRRKPLHTLNAWLVDEGSDLVAAGNCPGGDGQVQWNMQVISHLLDHGNDPQRAVSLPRVTVFPGSDANTLDAPTVVRCEEGLDPDALEELERRGHRVERLPVQRGGPGGSACVVAWDPVHGVLKAAADPRMDGAALAI
ncbi:gamma-glutamyltransferase [Nocardioides agariphilus]|uniref:Gamma-glutamyltransferase n=1 Tax=Nocardioides agariphilus TaxID=433664 RepID=A0A930VGQ5_9ACTN|nr:gamma-glutamyltransferase [Nocardioides agariphilus]